MDLSPKSKIFSISFLNGLRPDPILSVSEWSDKFRILDSKASAEPGKWRTSRTPYLKEIMDCLSSHSPIQSVTFMKGSQIGATEISNNWIGYIIDQVPSPVLSVQPNLDLAKRYSKQRIEPLIRLCTRLRVKVSDVKSRDSGNTMLSKEFEGGVLIITGSNSAVGLRSMPARFLLLDEIDAYPLDVNSEGDPVSLAEARSRTFSRRKSFKISTPTIEGRSRISQSFLNSDQRYYYVPCPHCNFYQTLQWKNIRWTKGEPSTAVLICEQCGAAIEEHKKTRMLELGKWIAQNPDHRNKKVVGFHLSSLYSPVGWFSWADAAELFEQAQKDTNKLRSFVNTVLGETWKEKGEAPEWKKLYDRRENYEFNVIPKGGLFITCGVDVQKNRLELEIVAWGRDRQSWSIDYRVINGDTATEEPFKELDKLLSETFPMETNEAIRLPIRLLAIDSGFQTQQIYNWARQHSLNKVITTKGSDRGNQIIGLPTSVDITIRGKKISRGARVWTIGTSIAKSELYSWLNLEKPINQIEGYPAGYCHFPQYDDNFFKMLTAEQLVVRIKGGVKRYIWEKYFERNEALDTRLLARAAASVIGLDRFREESWKEMEAQLGKNTDNKTKPLDKNMKNGEIVRKKSDFWGDK